MFKKTSIFDSTYFKIKEIYTKLKKLSDDINEQLKNITVSNELYVLLKQLKLECLFNNTRKIEY